MDNDEKLSDVPEEDLPLLLEDLKSDFPTSVHAWNFLVTIQKWKTVEPTIEARILAVNGDFRSKMIVYYTLSSDRMNFRGSVHKWSHQEDDTHILAEALKNTKKVPWNTKIFLLTALTPETDRAVIPALSEIWKGQSWHCESGHHIYWVPKEEAINWSVEPNPGTRLSFLTADHAEEVNKVWPHRFSGSCKIIAETIRLNFGIGLFDEASNELMAWAMDWFNGALGALQTKDHHKRKGYAKIVLKAVTKEIGKRDRDVYLNILPENVASLNLVKNCGYHFAYHSTWIFRGFKIVPEGAELSFLDEQHVEEINSVWPHRDDSSEKYLAMMMKVNFGLGLLKSDTRELLSWALHWFYGSLGVWQTNENHKKKGYGRVVLEATTKEIAKRGYDVHLNVLPKNVASISLVQKTPYKFAFYSTWIEKH